MAETLGSLVDKLTIKDLREFHLRQMVEQPDCAFPVDELKKKLAILENQKILLIDEINTFVAAAFSGAAVLRDEKLKLYNPKEAMGKIPELSTLGSAISCLAVKNSELWHLEDEARRKDVPLEHIGSVKRSIDLTNQQRNDLIDRIDAIFERYVTDRKNGAQRA